MKRTIDPSLTKITPEDKLPLLHRFAGEITGSFRRSIDALIATGGHLTEAKDQLGQIWQKSAAFGWKLFLRKQCHMSESFASKLMTIAKNTAISNSQNWPKLPYAVESLYNLAHTFSDQQLQEMLNNNDITPEMTNKDVKDLIDGRKQKQTDKASFLVLVSQ